MAMIQVRAIRLQTKLKLLIHIALVAALFAASGCAYTTAERVKASVGVPEPEIALFSHCSSYGCNKIQQVSFEDTEWMSVSHIFDTPVKTAEEERETISKAIALMEKIVGPKTGTSDDIARSWMLTFMPQGQLDCIDESINTTTYLNLLLKAGYINYHDIGQIAIRGNKLDFMMLHNTATLIEKDSGRSYAIDSWYRANGNPPDIVLLEEWLKGWKPES